MSLNAMSWNRCLFWNVLLFSLKPIILTITIRYCCHWSECHKWHVILFNVFPCPMEKARKHSNPMFVKIVFIYLDTSAVIILRSCLGNRLYEMIIILWDIASLTDILSFGLKFVFISTLQNWRLIAGIKIGWYEKCNVI